MAEQWKIRVSGYGTFDFTGTEAEAEEMRRHKAQWEGGNGHKYRVENQTEADRLMQRMCEKWDTHNAVSPALMKKYRTAIAARKEP